MLIITVLLKQLKNFITSGDNPLTLMQLPTTGTVTSPYECRVRTTIHIEQEVNLYENIKENL